MNTYYQNMPEPLTAEEINRAAREGNINQIVEHNLKLVVSIATKFNGLPFDDLVQEGNIGLMIAAERYDPDKGVKFSTYATPIITQHIIHAVQKEDPLSKTRYGSEQEKKVLDATQILQQALKRDPTIEELQSATGLTEKAIKRTQRKIVSIDEQEPEDSTTDPTEEAENAVLKRQMYDNLYLLTEAEKTVIYARYGLITGEEQTYDTIAEQMNCSRTWVRKLEKNALEKLQAAMQ